MKPFRFTIVACFLLLGNSFSLLAETREAESLFFEANVLAAEEAYAEAIPLFESALQQEPSANLHYNLGNAYYATGDWGRARIHWERTLAMAPRHTSARENLQLLLAEQGLPQSTPGLGANLASLLSLNQWTWAAVITFWIMLGGILALRWKKTPHFFALAALGAVGFLPSLAALFFVSPGFDSAVLLDDQIALRVAPAPASPVATTLRAAQHVMIVGTYEEFLRVRLENGQEGFIAASQAERIRSL